MSESDKQTQCGKCKGSRIVDDAGLLLASMITGGLVKGHNPPRHYGCPECSLKLHKLTHSLWKEIDASAAREAELQARLNRCAATQRRINQEVATALGVKSATPEEHYIPPVTLAVQIAALRQQLDAANEERKAWWRAFNRAEELIGLSSQAVVPDSAFPLHERITELRAEVERLKAVMSEVASMPGKDWLAGQLALAEALNPRQAAEAAKGM